jgi:hypothetical protein
MSEAPSIRDSLASAMSSLTDGAPEPAASSQTTAPAEAGDGGTKVIEPADALDAAPEGAPSRDAQGRFAAKAADATDNTTAQAGADATATPPADNQPPEPAKPEDNGAQPEPTRVPPSLSAAVKSQWSELPQPVRDEFSRLEDTFQKGKAEWSRKGERLNRYDEILGPRVDRWRLAGLDEFSGIQTLLAAQDVLERNPVEGLTHIARSYGVDLRALAGQAIQQPSGLEGQRAPTVAPELQTVLQPLVQQVQTLQQQLQQSQQQSEQQKVTEAQAEVQAFASDPNHLYFDNVREQVAALLSAGQAQTLAAAYEQAIWASPEIRPLLLADQAKAQQAEAQKRAQEQAARTKAATAQQAAGSVTGAPAPGAQPPPGPVGSIRDSLVQAAQATGWNV